ncbi:hypothetical protein POM88_041873 [Heracleum sosnowskyi]|uniref:Uncharacterized protein n=1 Tax=Heracleum sosnowskyi TaxID=360622 RepID=A0AAD8HHP9_9APIA|nr:hypothetical protein POM88_041873 [Heracleum sosnowskyi]
MDLFKQQTPGKNGDSRNLPDMKPRITDEPVDKSRAWKLAEINEPSQSNAVHKLWKWQKNEHNTSVKATASIVPQLWQPTSEILMTNDISDRNPEDAVPCFALSKNDSYVMVFHPQDNYIIAIGMEDSSIQIYNVRVDEVKIKLKGHHKRITGPAFSDVLNVLVSSGADSQFYDLMNIFELNGLPSDENPNYSGAAEYLYQRVFHRQALDTARKIM